MKLSNLTLLLVSLVGVAHAQPSISVTPAGGDEEIQGRLDDLESKIEGLHSAPPPSVTESQAVDDAAALHEMKQEDEENREKAEEEHEEHLEDAEKQSEFEAEENEGKKLAAKETKKAINAMKADDEALKEQAEHEKEQELAQIDSDKDKEESLADQDAAAEENMEAAARETAEYAEDAHEDAVDTAASNATVKAEKEIEHVEEMNEEQEEKQKVEEKEATENEDAAAEAEEKPESADIEAPEAVAEGKAEQGAQASEADAYTAAPCPCIKEQMDMEKGCEEGLKAPKKGPCPNSEKKVEELKEKEATVKHELEEATEGMREADGAEAGPVEAEGEEAEGEEAETEKEGLFLQRMSRLVKAHRPTHRDHTRLPRNLRKYALGFL